LLALSRAANQDLDAPELQRRGLHTPGVVPADQFGPNTFDQPALGRRNIRAENVQMVKAVFEGRGHLGFSFEPPAGGH
jgi:hypothetical protein